MRTFVPPAGVEVADGLEPTGGLNPWQPNSGKSLRGDHVPVVTHRGSRPGSSLADLMQCWH